MLIDSIFWLLLLHSDGARLLDSVKLSGLKFKRLFMVTKTIYRFPDGVEMLYGACTYAPVVEQTNEGMAKFFSILYYLVWTMNSLLCILLTSVFITNRLMEGINCHHHAQYSEAATPSRKDPALTFSSIAVCFRCW